MKTVWVLEPFEDGTCRIYSVTTRADGTFGVGEPVWHWTSMVLYGDPAYDVAEPGEATPELPPRRVRDGFRGG
jgi:hypothetical protein